MPLDLSMLDDVSALFKSQEQGKGIRRVRVDAIRPDPEQPRKTFEQDALSELAESIRAIGIIQPPVVRTADAGYMLISGERRWRAARQLGWETIDVIVRDDLNARAQLVENIQREALSVWEIYRVVSGELNAGTTQADLARALGKSRSWVTAYAAIDKMPESFITALRERRITGVTDLSQLQRLLEDAPADAARLLRTPGHISRSTIEKARREVSIRRASPTAPASCSHEIEMADEPVTPCARTDARADNMQLPSLDIEPKPKAIVRKHVRIRVHYEDACWVVDYPQQRELNGVVSVRLEGVDGSACFAPIGALRLQSIECI